MGWLGTTDGDGDMRCKFCSGITSREGVCLDCGEPQLNEQDKKVMEKFMQELKEKAKRKKKNEN